MLTVIKQERVEGGIVPMERRGRKQAREKILPTLFFVINKDCVLCADLVKWAKRVPNPVVFISAELLRYVEKGEEQAFIETLKLVNETWKKYSVRDIDSGRKVKEPVPLLYVMDEKGGSHIGPEALHYIANQIKDFNADEWDRLAYLCKEYYKRKKVRKSG